MLSKPVSKIFIILLVLVVAAVTTSFISHSANSSVANHPSDNSKPMPAEPAYVALEKQTLREYQLGERYGETPQDFAQQKLLREYWLGEKYGQTP